MDQWPDVKELFSNLVPAALGVIGNTALTAVLYGLEYLVEKNSPCPCDPEWNAIHSNLAFIVPTVVLLLISMMVVPRSRRMFKCGTCRPCPECGRCSGCSQCCTRSECPESGSRFPSCCNSCRKCCFELNTLMQISIPSIIWVVILLLDGDYVACYQAPSVNRTHGHQKCEQFCNLETSSSLRYYCFRSRIIGSIILGVSVFLLVLLKFFPRWTYCDYTEEGYYKFKYLQSLEKKKWKKIKKELGNMVAKTANVEAKELISNLSHYITDQGEQNPNHGAHSSNEGAQSSSQGDPNSSQDDQELQALITPASDSSA